MFEADWIIDWPHKPSSYYSKCKAPARSSADVVRTEHSQNHRQSNAWGIKERGPKRVVDKIDKTTLTSGLRLSSILKDILRTS